MADSKLKKLEEQLTCAICLGLYTNPKTLPCLHSFCTSCLEGISLTSETDRQFLSCPQCRTRSPVPQARGVAGFTEAYHINNLKKVHALLTKTSSPQQMTCENCKTGNHVTEHCRDCSQFYCQECVVIHKKWTPFVNHQLTNLSDIQTFTSQLFPSNDVHCTIHNMPLGLFCEVCSEIICEGCRISEYHRGHHYELVSDSYHKHCQKLEASLNPVTAGVNNAMSILSAEKEGEIKHQRDIAIDEIHSMVEGMMSLLRETEVKLTREVDTVIDGKLQVLSDQKKAAEASLSQLKDCEGFVEQNLKVNSPEKVLTSMKQMTKHMNLLSQKINVKDFKPTEEADVQLVKHKSVMDSQHHIGDIVFNSPSLVKQCKVKVNHSELDQRNGLISFPISLQFSDSSLVAVPLSMISCSLEHGEEDIPMTTIITTTDHLGVYRIHCHSIIRGCCLVTVRVGNVKLQPTVLVIPFNPSIDAVDPLHVIEGFQSPNGIVVTEDRHIIVTENGGSCISVLDKQWKKVKTFNAQECGVTFIHPRGLILTSDNCFLVLDDHRVSKMTMNGECIARVGRHGNGPLEFSYPGGITISPKTGNVWITDYCNDRVQILNPDLSFAFSIGSFGSNEGEFNGPTSVVVDENGTVYVVDCNNHRVQKFTEDGRFVSQFGTEGSDIGQLCHPVRMILDENKMHLYITEVENHRVSVFTTEGQFVCTFGEFGTERNQFNGPFGLEIDMRGYLYICDTNNDRVLIY